MRHSRPLCPARTAQWVGLLFLVVLVGPIVPCPAGAQDVGTRHTASADTTLPVALEPVMVTAERSEIPLAVSTSAVSHLTREELARFPRTTLADVLRQVPGVAIVDFDGHGHAPQVIVRGFYGGGEAEYVVVLVDGKRVNGVTGGLVRWDQIPATSIERIEVLRGGSSALWGDSAVGAVINVITRTAAGLPESRWSVAAGEYGSVKAAGQAGVQLAGRGLRISGGVERTDGFREGSDRNAQRVGGDYDLISGEERSLALSILSHRREFGEPGPLLAGELEADRRGRATYHRFDQTVESSHRVGLDGRRQAGARLAFSGSLLAERRDTEAVRTIRLAPEFADTKERVVGTGRVLGAGQLTLDGALVEGRDRLIVGWDASYARLTSRYYGVVTGPAPVYAGATGERGEQDAAGEGSRGAAAFFAQYTLSPTEAVRLSLGVRGDWIRDRFEPTAGEGGGEGGDRIRASHGEVSPKAGVNLRWLSGESQTGHVFVTAGRSFKAPTLDQLFDQRAFPLPVPPFSATTSNPELVPQHGRHVEAGLYHSAQWMGGNARADLSAAVYQIDMEDELDFDLQSLRYVNLGESRHRGFEAGLSVAGPRESHAFLNVTVQHATNRGGDFDGRQLKAIPRRVVGGGVSAVPFGRLEAGLRISHARGIHLDDENTIELPPFTRTDLRLSHPLAGVSLFLDVRNLLDARFSTTGYPDPGGSGGVYTFPAAGRTFELGIRSGRR